MTFGLEMPTCWFCEDNLSTREADLVVSLRGKKLGTKKTGFKEYTTYYEKKVVRIPRCPECKKKHEKVKKIKGWNAIFFPIPLIFYAIVTYLGLPVSIQIISTILGIIIAAGLWYYFIVVRIRQIEFGIKDDGYKNIINNPAVKKSTDKGWNYDSVDLD
jgi:hypothetical protein